MITIIVYTRKYLNPSFTSSFAYESICLEPSLEAPFSLPLNVMVLRIFF